MSEIKKEDEKKEDKFVVSYDDMYESKYQEAQTSNLILEILKNVRPGVDLFRIPLPAWILEKRSFLEKLTDLFLHQQLVLNVATMVDPEQRFLTMCRLYMAMWHRIPKTGVAKPYNPILGEQFECVWKYQTSQSEFYAEQVSHHPPVSAFYYRNKNKNLLAYGNLEPQASLHPFGNYAATSIVGKFVFRICNYEEDYEWIYPSIYTRGVFYGTLNMENAGESEVSCSKTGFSCKFDWKDSRTVIGKVYKKDQHLYTITGDYTDQIQIKHLGKKKVFPFLDVKKMTPSKKTVPTWDQMSDYNSRKVWHSVSEAIQKLDYPKANELKNEIEEKQRQIRKKINEKEWKPKFFKKNEKGGGYMFLDFDDSKVDIVEEVKQ